MRGRAAWVVVALLLVPKGASADRHKAGGRAAYVEAYRSELRGGEIGGEWVLESLCPKRVGTFALAFDVVRLRGDHSEDLNEPPTSLTQWVTVAGIRYTVGHGFIQPFVHAMAGLGHLNQGPSRHPFASKLGFGVDIPLGSSGPGKHPRLVMRGELNQAAIAGDQPDSYIQWSAGLVIRFNH